MIEIWKDIKDYEGLYQVSNLGNIKSLARYRGGNSKKYFIEERILKIKYDFHGRPCVNLSKDGVIKVCRIHQLVAIAFLGHKKCGHELVVDHIDNDKTNNNLSNLQIITSRENTVKDMLKGSSRFVGVYMDKAKNKWRSVISVKKKKTHLGYFENEIEAYIAYENERLSIC